ncbi:MAG: DNA polymerase I [candidate division Zixibacteria bacterium]|nr:DNA polymerase I [candidate division Zixibacteria bacterium]
MSKRKTLYLVDGSAMFYRAFFAFIRNPLINSKGENTSATFGFVNSLWKIIREEQPDYLAVAFDSKQPTFRHEMYAEYKSHRAKMPDELVAQLPRIREAVQALNIPEIELPGYEADDIIATLARQAEKEGLDVWCVTGDKDYFQLVTDHIRIYHISQFSKPESMGPAEVLAKFGVRPDQVIDKLALMGDSSDNVPGVPGIGPKTADSLLNQFGTLDQVLAGIDKISAKGVREKIAANIEMAKLSRELVTLHSEVPVSATIESLARRPVDAAATTKLFTEMEFGSLLKQVVAGSTAEEKPAETAKAKYWAVTSLDHLKKLVMEFAAKKEIAVDTETTSTNPLTAELVGISLCDLAGEAFYLPVGHSVDRLQCLPIDEALAIVKPLLEDARVQKIGQNMKYDWQVLHRYGIDMAPLSFDTMIASYVIDPSGRQHNLNALALRYFTYTMQPITDLIGSGKNQRTFDTVPVDKAAFYAAEDADYTYRLRGKLAPEIDNLKLNDLYYNIELPLVKVLAKMEEAGVRIDGDFLEVLSREMESKLAGIRKEIYAAAGMEFNINSTQQLSHILFEKLQLPTKGKTTKKTGFSTDVGVLEELARIHPFPQLILDYRQLTKLTSTYIDALPELINPKTGRVHTSFNQTIAATGRLSSTDPNLQNIPVRTEEGRQIRKAFIPRDGDYVLLAADYSQIELRILAHYASDEVLITAFKNGEDIHVRTAAEVYGVGLDKVTGDMRRVAKTANFAIIYGVSAYGLSQQTGMSVSEAKEFIDTYFNRYPGIRTYIETTKQFARDNGYVTTLFNRRRYLPEINDRNFNVQQFAERTAINTPIQGTAADIIKKAMIQIHGKLEGFRTRMVLQVHDELVFDVYKQELDDVRRIVKDGMEKVIKLKVPLVADMGVGENWLEAK